MTMRLIDVPLATAADIAPAPVSGSPFGATIAIAAIYAVAAPIGFATRPWPTTRYPVRPRLRHVSRTDRDERVMKHASRVS
jgi:hypothetical protein